jgi:dTDP-3-amino-3,4,6-trideoxy-alpha-D-glucose transaminase
MPGLSGVTPVAYVNFRRFAECHGDEIRSVFTRVLESGTYIGGDEVTGFESAFASFCGTRYAIGVANGTEAIELTLRAWGIGPGDEVIVPASTAIQTALAVTHTGARPVPADVEPDTGLLDPAAAEAALTPRTRAIVPVHLYGHPAAMTPLRDIAERAHVRLLEDAAHAHGARYRDHRCGSLADAAAFSFYPTKNLGALGDGGCVTTDDARLAESLRSLRSGGLTVDYLHVVKGYTSRLDSVQAAVLRWKLEHLDAWNERRERLAAAYVAGLSGVSGLTLPTVRPWATPVWHAFAVCAHDGRRDELQRALTAGGIATNIHYRVPVHLQPCYADAGWGPGDFPVSERRATMQLSLPLDPFHTDAEISRVIGSVRAALKRRERVVS